MFLKQIKFKVSLFLAIALAPVVILFPYLIVQNQRDLLQEEISRHIVQVSELVVKSTRYAMLVNEKEIADKIIQDIGQQEGIERVRIISKEPAGARSSGALTIVECRKIAHCRDYV